VAIHDKSREHKCPKCNKAFARHDNLSEHASRVHKISIPKKSRVIRTKICVDCGAATKYLSRHVCPDKKRRLRFRCQCGQTFGRRYHLLRHVGSKNCCIGANSGVQLVQPTIGDDGQHLNVGQFSARRLEKRSDIHRILN
jgi:heterodisulfide reductase subunit B